MAETLEVGVVVAGRGGGRTGVPGVGLGLGGGMEGRGGGLGLTMVGLGFGGATGTLGLGLAAWGGTMATPMMGPGVGPRNWVPGAMPNGLSLYEIAIPYGAIPPASALNQA